MLIKDIMTTQIASVTPETPIKEVAKKMRDLNVGSIPVCNSENQVQGIVTDRDIVIRGVVDGVDSSESIEKVMSKHPITVTPDTHVHEAARMMGENQIRRLPVVENGKIVGIVAIGDLAVRNIYEDEAGNALSEISMPSRPMM